MNIDGAYQLLRLYRRSRQTNNAGARQKPSSARVQCESCIATGSGYLSSTDSLESSQFPLWAMTSSREMLERLVTDLSEP